MSEHPEALRLAYWLKNAVQTYPQMSEDEPGGYYTQIDQVMDESAAELRRPARGGEAVKCRLCGRGLSQIGGYLQRTNEKGVPGNWECRPTCDADLPKETSVLLAVEGEDVADGYMDAPVTESERAKVARKHQLSLRGEVKP